MATQERLSHVCIGIHGNTRKVVACLYGHTWQHKKGCRMFIWAYMATQERLSHVCRKAVSAKEGMKILML